MRKKNNYQKYLPLILAPLAVILGLKLWKLYNSAGKTAANVITSIKNDVTGSVINAALQNNNLSPIRSSAITDIVENIYAAFYKDNFWGMGEDEEKAIENFNQLLNTSEARAAAVIYKANFKKNLNSDMVKYCHGEHFKAIKQSLLNATK